MTTSLSASEIAEIIRRTSADGKPIDPDAIAATLRRALGTVTLDEYIAALPGSINTKVGEGYDEAALRAWGIVLSDGASVLSGIISRVSAVVGEDAIRVNGAVAIAAGDRITDADFALLTDPVASLTSR